MATAVYRAIQVLAEFLVIADRAFLVGLAHQAIQAHLESADGLVIADQEFLAGLVFLVILATQEFLAGLVFLVGQVLAALAAHLELAVTADIQA